MSNKRKPGRPSIPDELHSVGHHFTLNREILENIRTYPRGSLRKVVEQVFAKPMEPALPKTLRWEDFA
jgi:hypothetical protein